ncbi:hypothetical protein F443_07878 [Phytophthora nicotianae P1569]|uniref:Uncharacterized protein n=1 Tax=Phytophthora nicotianae P1569 TaxID=1317065 RepID=V9F922_PHYNI|nr:hypothetical protein F443_07878 [Phytophthora nicotianae P1569]
MASNPLERVREQRAMKLLTALQDDLHAQMRLEKDELGRSEENKRASLRRKARIARLSDPQERERIWSREQLPSYEGVAICSLPKTRDFWREVEVSVWCKDQLDAACTLLDLPIHGKKLELVARIQDWVHEPEILARLEEQRLLELQQDAILASGRVFAFGSNTNGELGLGHRRSCEIPTEIESFRGAHVASVYSGFDANFAFARTEDGLVYAWGGAGQVEQNKHHARGGDGSCFLFPRLISSLSSRHSKHIACGRTGGHVAITSDKGECFTWGRGEYGELGTNTCESGAKAVTEEPTRVKMLNKVLVIAVSVGNTHTAAITDKGRLYTWGSCWSGQLGLGESKRAGVKDKHLQLCFPTPTIVEALQSKRITRVSCGAVHTAVVSADGQLFTFGCGDGGRLGLGSNDGSFHPQHVSALENHVVLDVSCGSWHTLCIALLVTATNCNGSNGGFVYAFGSGLQGQVCFNTFSTCLPALRHRHIRCHAITTSSHHSCALAVDGNLYTWGQNASGCLGRKGSEIDAPELAEPAVVDRGSFRGYGVGPIVSIAAGHGFTLFATGPWEPREEPAKLQFQLQTKVNRQRLISSFTIPPPLREIEMQSAPPSSQGSMINTGVYRYERNRGSHEFFSPGPHATTRTATAPSAIFNLVSTIIGGGILSLPFAFDKCGLVVAFIFMVTAASASTFSLYVIVSCSRRGSAASYEEVVRKALGARAGRITVVLLVLLTFLTLVAYVILTKDLVGSLGASFLYNRPLSNAEQNILTIVCVLLVSPALLARSMDALRFTSVFSLVSVLVLAIAITVRAADATFSRLDIQEESGISIKLTPDSWADAAYAFPIISVSFLCHFNVLPVYRELHKPTRHRLKKIVASTMFSTWLFYILVGIMGYLFAFRQEGGVQGDILNNFSDNDPLVNLGRLGLLVTIQLSLPLIIQPCRANLLRLAKIVRSYMRTRAKVYDAPDSTDSENEGETMSEGTALLPSNGGVVPSTSTGGRYKSTVVHVLLTVGIMSGVITIALLSPGVAVVWNLMGSTVGLLISYVLPCVSYVCIRREKPNTDRRKLMAWVILAISSIVCAVCTVQAFVSVFSL